MTSLALAFLGVYAVAVLATSFPRWLTETADWLNRAIWLALAVDLAVRLYLAENRVRWVLRHPIDVASVALPMLRPLRVLRAFTAGQSLLNRRGGLLRTGQAVLLSAGLLIVVGALAELDAERDVPGASIVTFGDALWWAITTVTTVGYGDLYPVSGTGRVVAAALMVVGISVLGVVTASVAAWFVQMAEQAAGAGAGTHSGTDADAQTGSAAAPAGPTGPDHRALLGTLRRAGVLTDDEVSRAEARLPAD
jgi:voltage-gated potassium channel